MRKIMRGLMVIWACYCVVGMMSLLLMLSTVGPNESPPAWWVYTVGIPFVLLSLVVIGTHRANI